MDFHSYPSIASLCVEQARRSVAVAHKQTLFEQLFQAVVTEAWSKAIALIKAISELPLQEHWRSESSPILVAKASKLIKAIRNPRSAGPSYGDLTALLQECRDQLLAQEAPAAPQAVDLRAAA